jgi:hypothetical protein
VPALAFLDHQMSRNRQCISMPYQMVNAPPLPDSSANGHSWAKLLSLAQIFLEKCILGWHNPAAHLAYV